MALLYGRAGRLTAENGGLRPGQWGFYNMPGATAESRPGAAAGNPTLNWLWQSVDALFPSIYLSYPDLPSNLITVARVLGEARRVSALSTPPKPVYAYTMAEFDDDAWNHAAPEMMFLDPGSFQLEFNHSASEFGLAGLILYGGSADGKSPERCAEVRDYMTSTFLPAIEAIVRERNSESRAEGGLQRRRLGDDASGRGGGADHTVHGHAPHGGLGERNACSRRQGSHCHFRTPCLSILESLQGWRKLPSKIAVWRSPRHAPHGADHTVHGHAPHGGLGEGHELTRVTLSFSSEATLRCPSSHCKLPYKI
jgi:hypothetical protein